MARNVSTSTIVNIRTPKSSPLVLENLCAADSRLQMRRPLIKTIRQLVKTKVKEVTSQKMINITETCGNLPSSQKISDVGFMNGIWNFFRVIFPETKWCGMGDVAESYPDLGSGTEDICCRNHDFCPINVEGGKRLNNLENTARHTYTFCACDVAFLRCLETGKSATLQKAFRVLVRDCLAVKKGNSWSTDVDITITPSTNFTIIKICEYDPILCQELGLDYSLFVNGTTTDN